MLEVKSASDLRQQSCEEAECQREREKDREVASLIQMFKPMSMSVRTPLAVPKGAYLINT